MSTVFLPNIHKLLHCISVTISNNFFLAFPLFDGNANLQPSILNAVSGLFVSAALQTCCCGMATTCKHDSCYMCIHKKNRSVGHKTKLTIAALCLSTI